MLCRARRRQCQSSYHHLNTNSAPFPASRMRIESCDKAVVSLLMAHSRAAVLANRCNRILRLWATIPGWKA